MPELTDALGVFESLFLTTRVWDSTREQGLQRQEHNTSWAENTFLSLPTFWEVGRVSPRTKMTDISSLLQLLIKNTLSIETMDKLISVTRITSLKPSGPFHPSASHFDRFKWTRSSRHFSTEEAAIFRIPWQLLSNLSVCTSCLNHTDPRRVDEFCQEQ